VNERLEPKDDKPVARSSLGWTIAITAVIAGLGGVLVGFVLSRSREVPQAPVVAPAPSAPSALRGASSSTLLSTTLENDESGKAVAEGDRSVQISLTFETEDGRYCRAFSSSDAGAAAEGVACRNGTQWQVVAWDGTVDPGESLQAAGASELLDDVIDRLGGGAPLGAAEERELIEHHWSAPQR
jgi:hypothetical protein